MFKKQKPKKEKKKDMKFGHIHDVIVPYRLICVL